MPKKRVLVVDDERTFLQLAEHFLTPEGFETEVTDSAAEAFSLLERSPFDLLLSDIRMPGFSGLEMLRHAKACRPDILVILMTGYGTVPTVMEALRGGASGYVLKPFTQQGLLSVIQNALEKDRLRRENLRIKSLMSLVQLSRMLMLNSDSDALLAHIVGWIREETRTERVSLMFRDEKNGELVTVATTGTDAHGEMGAEGIARLALEKREPVFIQGTSGQNAYLGALVGPSKTASLLALPICLREKAVGVVQIYSTHPLGESDKELVSIFCKQAAIAIENARLFQSVQKSYIHTLRALISAIEVKDRHSKGHADGVERYALLLADPLSLTQSQRHNLSLAATLHDIGQIGSQDEVLRKETSLSAEEFEQIKNHSADAAGILSPIRLDPEIVRSILHHHERWDGLGYPHRLKGEDIPLYSRIIAIADAMDTMTQPRLYRCQLTPAEACEELARNAGTQFDPRLVEVFLSLEMPSTLL
jgi:response regulator RpfG family c-di-GMP phosphodiesterase